MGLGEKRMVVYMQRKRYVQKFIRSEETITSPPKHLRNVKCVQSKKLDFSMRAKRGEDGPALSFDEASVSTGSIIFFL